MPCDTLNRRALAIGQPSRSAYSLIEVVAAIGLMGATLVPALELVRSSMEQSSETDQRQLLALYAVSQIEQQLGIVGMSWSTGTFSGDYSADDNPNIRYDTVTSDELVNGGIPDSLMDIRTTVYLDDNADDALSSGELQCTFRTKRGYFDTEVAQMP